MLDMSEVKVAVVGSGRLQSVVLIKGEYGLALGRLHSYETYPGFTMPILKSAYWSPICRCGCRMYPKEELEALEKELAIKVFFEDSVIRGGREIFPLNEYGRIEFEEVIKIVPEGTILATDTLPRY
ncbi:MAG: hypothetical protein WAV16_01875 [Candidatus Moraniibacteriota bacterium]